MVYKPSLADIVSDTSHPQIIENARRIEAQRAGETDPLKTLLGDWLGLDQPGLWTTPFMVRAGIVAREAGIIAFDRLERTFLSPHPSWVHPEIGAQGYVVRRGSERLLAPDLWPFAQDCPMGDYQSANLPPKWLSHGLVHAHVGFGWWPDLREWELMHMARLSEAVAAFHWYWLAELGRLDLAGLEIDPGRPRPRDIPVYSELEEAAQKHERRLALLEGEAAERIAFNGREMMMYETYAFRRGAFGGELVEPTSSYLSFGDTAEYAKTHIGRLRSPAYRRFVENCFVAGRDYATDLPTFEDRAAATLRALYDRTPPSPEEGRISARRARRVLADVGWRICHMAALHGDGSTVLYQGGLDAVAQALAAIDEERARHDDLIASALESVVADLGSEAANDVLALGYAPTRDPEKEPPVVQAIRARALVRRAWCQQRAVGAALEGMPQVARRVVARPRNGRLTEQLVVASQAATEAGEVSNLGYAYCVWLNVVGKHWELGDEELVARRWSYRLARRRVPEDPAEHGAYEVAWNPYLRRFPMPFDARWNAELSRTTPGSAPPFRGKVTTATWYCYVGPGREGPAYVPLVSRLNALIFALKTPKRLDALVADPDFGLELMKQAVDDEVVLLFHKPHIARDESPVDIFDYASGMATTPDNRLEPFGPWNEKAQADAYEAFCARSAHYQDSSRALLDVADIRPDARVGELGFGTGVTTRLILERLGEKGQLLAADPAPLMLERITKAITDPRVRFRLGGARALAWAATYEGGFDRIVGNAAIWLSQDIAEALGKLNSAAKTGGRLALSIPAEFLGHLDHMRTPSALAISDAFLAAGTELGIGPPRPDKLDEALGSVEAFMAALETAGWENAKFTVFERPWTAGEYLEWCAMPAVAEGLVAPEDKARAAELVEAVRRRVDLSAPMVARWYLITAERVE